MALIGVRRILLGGRPYSFANPEASALVARMTTPPTNARKRLIDNLVGSLKAGGVWSKLDCLYVMAAADSQAARLNWVADQYNLVAVSGPTFTVDRGYQGDGAASWLTSGFNPTTALAPKYTLNDAYMGGWNRTESQSDGLDVGNTNGALLFRNSLGNAATRSNAASNNATMAVAVGYLSWSRDNSANYSRYKNGALLSSPVNASTSLSNEAMFVCGRGPASSSPKQEAVALWGSNLSAAQDLAAYNALNTYLQAVGAA